jgi:hypothetical protein
MKKVKKMNKFEKIRSFAYNSIQSSTTHGLPNLFKTGNKYVRLMWIVCLLASSALCFFLIAKSISEYLQYQVVTQISVIYQVPMEFPSVSICLSNFFANTETIEFGKKILADNNITNITNSPLLDLISPDYLKILSIQYLIGSNLKNPNLNQEQVKNTTLSFEDIFISCSYNFVPCYASDFEWSLDTLFGVCYKFNPNGTVKAYREGILNGFQMELFVPDLGDTNLFSPFSGVNVYVNNASATPSYMEGVKAKQGTQTDIRVAKEVTKKLMKPFSECIADLSSINSPLYALMIQQGRTYTRKDCFDLCFQEFLYGACGCIDVSMAQIPNRTICLSFADLLCNFQTFNVFYSNITSRCGPLCPLECERMDYPVSLSYGDYPTRAYANFILNETKTLARFFPNQSVVTYEQVKAKCLAVNVFYDELKYTAIEEKEKTSMIDLIAAIGGTLGLCVGMSFLSFIEPIEVILEIAFILSQKKPKPTGVQI